MVNKFIFELKIYGAAIAAAMFILTIGSILGVVIAAPFAAIFGSYDAYMGFIRDYLGLFITALIVPVGTALYICDRRSEMHSRHKFMVMKWIHRK